MTKVIVAADKGVAVGIVLALNLSRHRRKEARCCPLDQVIWIGTCKQNVKKNDDGQPNSQGQDLQCGAEEDDDFLLEETAPTIRLEDTLTAYMRRGVIERQLFFKVAGMYIQVYLYGVY